MTMEPDPIPRNYRRRTHEEVRAEGYQSGWHERDETATQQSLAWMRRERELVFRSKVAFVCGAVGGMVLLAFAQILL